MIPKGCESWQHVKDEKATSLTYVQTLWFHGHAPACLGQSTKSKRNMYGMAFHALHNSCAMPEL
jgi:hypothetical protein